MTDLRSATIHATPIAYTPPHLGDALMARLSEGERPSGIPLLDWESAAVPSDPPDLDRASLVDALQASHQQMGVAPPTECLDGLRRDAWLVVTGQQPGLLTGPAYALFKALSAVQVAKRLSASTGRQVIPAFWIASEDHDLLEVNHAWLGSRRYECSREQIGRPVEWISPADECDAVLAFCQRQLADRPFADMAIEAVEHATFDNYPAHFAQLLARLLGDQPLLLINPMHLRQVFAPAMARVVGPGNALNAALTEGTNALTARDVNPQLDGVSMFRFDDQMRARCPLDDDLPKRIADDPVRFSPGAALRPIVQDAALPVLCTIGGPAEMRYLWQIDPLYQLTGVRRSLLWPRISASVLDADARTIMTDFQIDDFAVAGLPDMLDRYDPMNEVDAPFERAADEATALHRSLAEAIEALGRDDQAIDRSLKGIDHHVAEAIRQAAHQHAAARGRGKQRLADLVSRLYPGGVLAERRLSGLDYFARYGPALIDAVLHHIDARQVAHHLIELDNR